jgi:translation initiation factor IF-3
MDFGKYKYEKSKRAKQSKKKQHVVHVKEIKLRPKTEEHDFQFKKKHAEEFLAKHDRVKFTVFFRGREFDHQELGVRILARMRDELAHVGFVEKAAQFEGRVMTMFLSPHPNKPGQRPKQPEKKREEPARPAADVGSSSVGDAPSEPESKKEVQDAETQDQ